MTESSERSSRGKEIAEPRIGERSPRPLAQVMKMHDRKGVESGDAVRVDRRESSGRSLRASSWDRDESMWVSEKDKDDSTAMTDGGGRCWWWWWRVAVVVAMVVVAAAEPARGLERGARIVRRKPRWRARGSRHFCPSAEDT